MHQRIADEVKRKLQAKGESTEGVENFEAFYGMIRDEALKLQQEYQPQLRNGIKIAVDLVNQVQKDKQDGDVDIRVEIAPNKTVVVTSIDFNSTEDEKQKNQDFIDGITGIIDDLYKVWTYKETEFEDNRDAIETVNVFFVDVMREVEEYKSVDMDGFSGITTELDGDGRKRKIKVRRDNRSIGNVKANYEVVLERKEKKKEPLIDKGVVVPEDYVRVAGWSKTGQKIYKHKTKKLYISRDIADEGKSHSGGVWKMATSVGNLNKKETRLGTYDENLNQTDE